MAKRDVLLRLSKAQAEAVQYAANWTLGGHALADPRQVDSLRIANMKLTRVLERHEQKIAEIRNPQGA